MIGLMFTKWLRIDCIAVFENGYIIHRQLTMGRAATKSGRGNNTKNLSPFHSLVILVIFHPFYLPLAAAVNQNLKVIVRKRINVENKEFKCISFADDVTCFLHHKKPDVGQFLTAHIRMMNAQDLSSLKQDIEEAHCFNGQFLSRSRSHLCNQCE